MRLKEPRVHPLAVEDVEGEAREILSGFVRDGEVPRIFGTLAHHPKLLKRWSVFGNHVLGKSTLPPRTRELLILRIGWLCRSEYEFSQHVRIGKRAGLNDADIDRIKQGPDAPGLDPFDQVLLRAVDELQADAFVSDKTWNALAEQLDVQQLMDVLFTVGQYRLVSQVLNSLGVRPEVAVDGFPD